MVSRSCTHNNDSRENTRVTLWFEVECTDTTLILDRIGIYILIWVTDPHAICTIFFMDIIHILKINNFTKNQTSFNGLMVIELGL